MIARGWISRGEVDARLLAASFANGLAPEDGWQRGRSDDRKRALKRG